MPRQQCVAARKLQTYWCGPRHLQEVSWGFGGRQTLDAYSDFGFMRHLPRDDRVETGNLQSYKSRRRHMLHLPQRRQRWRQAARPRCLSSFMRCVPFGHRMEAGRFQSRDSRRWFLQWLS